MSFHTDWFTNNIPIWKKLLKKLKHKPDLSFLEIGCYEGMATLWLLENILTHPSSKITVIDTFKGSMENKDPGQNTKNLLKDFKENLASYISKDRGNAKVIIKKGLSRIHLRKFHPQHRFDFIYIDGSHIARDVLEDAILSWRLLKKDGILFFDDYGWRIYKNPLLRPDLAINIFLLIFEGQYQLLHKDYQVALLKKGDDISIPKVLKGNATEYIFIENNKLQELESKIKVLSEDLAKKVKLLEDSKRRTSNLMGDLEISRRNLEKIKTTKFYKIWQAYCKIKNFISTKKTSKN